MSGATLPKIPASTGARWHMLPMAAPSTMGTPQICEFPVDRAARMMRTRQADREWG
jgi:hypothetical protein